ncbi:TetR/AcrR family transcriptional regulator [Celerinatantimonas sp. MCCC 1A17872]|uniref:TetR/AcrR family transcriptional regulator n=1 Tax=Celerinatantimonas sp. MCCC 1A17872 TaxID=3177514 RepID=UPI0038C10EB2
MDTTNNNDVRRRTRLSPEARRKQLMECATKVFSKRGIGRAGHAEIAELANVSVATVFNYFNTREDLVDDVLAEVEKRILALVNNTFSQDKTPLQSIHDYVEALVDTTFNEPDVVHIWLEWSSSVREDVWPRFTKIQSRINEIIGQSLQKGFEKDELTSAMNADNAAQALTASFYLSVQMVNRPDQPSREVVIDFINDYVTSLLRPLR